MLFPHLGSGNVRSELLRHQEQERDRTLARSRRPRPQHLREGRPPYPEDRVSVV